MSVRGWGVSKARPGSVANPGSCAMSRTPLEYLWSVWKPFQSHQGGVQRHRIKSAGVKLGILGTNASVMLAREIVVSVRVRSLSPEGWEKWHWALSTCCDVICTAARHSRPPWSSRTLRESPGSEKLIPHPTPCQEPVVEPGCTHRPL